jgi:hypothetical protein
MEQAAMSKTASDKNKKSDELLHNQASKRPMTPPQAGFFLSGETPSPIATRRRSRSSNPAQTALSALEDAS